MNNKVVEIDSSASFEELTNQATVKYGALFAFEKKQILELSNILKDASRFVDVGANEGLYSFIANGLMKDSQIIMIEANPSVCNTLRESILKWPNNNGNNIIVLQTAAGNAKTSLPFRAEPESTLGSFVASDLASYSSNIINVPVDTLDNLLAVRARTVFKIDVEGFEYRVIEGGLHHFMNQDCKVMIELHGWGDKEIGKYPFHVLNFMRKEGFSVEQIEGTHYLFQKRSFWRCLTSYFKHVPVWSLKYLLRLSGLRPAYRKAVVGLSNQFQAKA